jgi:outer membrane lipoprotein LolB
MVRCITLLACSLLAACASAPPGTLAPRDQVREFALEARFALRVSPPDRPPRVPAVDSNGSTEMATTAS